MASDHILGGNDVDREGTDSWGVEHTAKGSQQGDQKDHRHIELAQKGQQTYGQHQNALQRIDAHHYPLAVAFVNNAAGEGGEEHSHEHGDGGHNAHQGAGAGLLIDPVADGYAVHQIADGTDGASLQQQDKIAVPKFFRHGCLLPCDDGSIIEHNRGQVKRRAVEAGGWGNTTDG